METAKNFQIVFVVVAKVIYNIYLHPLAKYPGPKLCAVSSIPVASAQLKGKLHNFTKKLHDRYGDVVRISPSELSFISAAAWNDIYARRNGKPALARDKTFFNDMLVGQDTMTMADDAKHARLRRAMNPAFAPRALAAQEAIIQKSITLFLNRVHDLSVQGSLVDLRLWYNYVTFDVIGDLAFGDSFGCLENSKYHDWVTFVLDYFYASTLLQVVHRFRPLNRLFAAMIPASLADKRKKHEEMALEKVRRRIKRGAERPDFTHPLIEAEKDGTISTSELEHQASILILAGSETTSVALTSATHLLLENPKALAKLVKELRNSFRSESEVDVLSIHKLHYLQAVIQETLRLYPPITNGFPRQPYDENAVVDGHLIPYGVSPRIKFFNFHKTDLSRLLSTLVIGVRIGARKTSQNRMNSSRSAG